MNTGFGGSADTRTKDVYGLQNSLMQLVQSGVLTMANHRTDGNSIDGNGLHAMPGSHTKATMLVRCNSMIRGHSAMSLPVVNAIIELLRRNITPLVPLRGSISASGDLMPLSYIAGAIQGNPDVFVRTSSPRGQDELVSAQTALERVGLSPIILGPKEGLSLINGTAASAAVASLALHDTQRLAVLSQLLTALTSEALASNVEWAHPFIAQVHPHVGQIEAAQNIRSFLSGSKLTNGLETTKDRLVAGLAQDRYALRSSPQWIGPQLEDLILAENQLTVELNSTSDNPIVNVAQDDIHSGANFQATAVTSAAEKTRSCLQMLGKLLFSQTSEMINHNLNNGLPSNLVADDPSLSFCLKGVDVNMAAYQSEIAYLANPVSSHVQAAEMHNQAINSLALLSARYTATAVELLSLMAASSIYTGCQGVDLRVMHLTFLDQFKSTAHWIFSTALLDTMAREKLDEAFADFWKALCANWYKTGSLDADERCEHATSTLAIVLTQPPHLSSTLTLIQVHELQKSFCVMMLEFYRLHRESFFKQPTTAQYLGHGSKRLYTFVRDSLGVPMHCGLVEHPTPQDKDNNMLNGRAKKTIGSWISIVHEAVCDGRIHSEVMGCIEDSGLVEPGVCP